MKLTLRLTIELEYELNDPQDEAYLRDRLADLPSWAASEGLYTSNSESTVESWSYKVETLSIEGEK